jgi:hypothetical protein
MQGPTARATCSRRAPSFSIADDGRLDDAAQRALPAGMRGADHARAWSASSTGAQSAASTPSTTPAGR